MISLLLMAAAVTTPIEDIRWLSRPNGDQVAAVYPPAALGRQMSGQVVFNCLFGATGRLEDCVIESETPPNAGFQEAGLKLSNLFHATSQREDGLPLEGRPFRLSIRFVPPTATAAAYTVSVQGVPAGSVRVNCRMDGSRRLDDCLVSSDGEDGLHGRVALKLIEQANAALPQRKSKSYSRVSFPIVFTAP